MTIEQGLARYRADKAPPPAPPSESRVTQALARALAALRPDPGGTVAVSDLVSAVRRALPQRYRLRLRRCEVTAALDDLGIPIGSLDRRQVAIGYSMSPPSELTVVDGKVRSA